MAIKNKAQKIRFVFVGFLNTVIDFSFLFLLKSIGLPEIPSNIISTFIAFSFSFFANKTYTFKSSGGNIIREMILFTVVALFGAWVIQSFVLWSSLNIISSIDISEYAKLFIAKIIAVLVSMVWSYIMYSRFVFKKSKVNK